MQEYLANDPGLFALAFPVFFVGMWLLVTALISFFGGWASLAERFRATSPFTGKTCYWQNGELNRRTRYGGVLNVGANHIGLHLAVMFLFRFAHPPLFIPWTEISIRKVKRLFIFDRIEITLGRDEQIPLVVSMDLAERLKRFSDGGWPRMQEETK